MADRLILPLAEFEETESDVFPEITVADHEPREDSAGEVNCGHSPTESTMTQIKILEEAVGNLVDNNIMAEDEAYRFLSDRLSTLVVL